MPSPYDSKLMVAESAIETYIAGKSTSKQLEETVGKAFSAANFNGKHKNFQIILPKKSPNAMGNGEFFGAICFPAINYIDQIAEHGASFTPIRTMKELWADIDEWVIEIDPKIFDTSLVSLNHKEIVAVLLHEIGHVTFTDKAVSRFMRSVEGVVAKSRMADKAAVKAGYALFMIPVGTAIKGVSLWRTIRTGGDDYRGDEKYADNFAVKCGYGDALLSAMDKLIMAFGAKDAKTDELEANKEIDAEMRWSLVTTQDVTARRNNLAKNLVSKAVSTSSVYMKGIVSKVMDDTGVKVYDKYDGGALESNLLGLMHPNADRMFSATIDTEQFANWDAHVEAARNSARFRPGTPAFESIFRQKVKKGLPTQQQIDEIGDSLDKIRNQVDRDVVLDRIYDMLDEINEYMEYAEAKPEVHQKAAPQAHRFIQQLESYRDMAIKKNVYIGGGTAKSGTGKSGRTVSAQQMMRTGDYSALNS